SAASFRKKSTVAGWRYPSTCPCSCNMGTCYVARSAIAAIPPWPPSGSGCWKWGSLQTQHRPISHITEDKPVEIFGSGGKRTPLPCEHVETAKDLRVT